MQQLPMDEIDAKGIPVDEQTLEQVFYSSVRSQRSETALRILQKFVQ